MCFTPYPAEMLHGRQLRTNLPSTRPAEQSDDTLEAESCRQQSYVQTTSSKQLSPLQEGHIVSMYNQNIHIWKPATVTQVFPTPRCYQSSTNDGSAYRRNMHDICVTPSTTHTRVTPPHNPNWVIPDLNVSPTLPCCNSCGSNVTQPQSGSTHDRQYVMDVYRSQPPDISRDIGYEHDDEQDYY